MKTEKAKPIMTRRKISDLRRKMENHGVERGRAVVKLSAADLDALLRVATSWLDAEDAGRSC